MYVSLVASHKCMTTLIKLLLFLANIYILVKILQLLEPSVSPIMELKLKGIFR